MKIIENFKEKIILISKNDWILRKNDREKFLSAVYLFVLLVLCFVKLEPYALPQLDDMTHAAIGRSILMTGDWFTMHAGDTISWLKPPLYFWMEAVFFRLFGVSEYWAKFPAALTGFLTFFFAYKLVFRMFNRKIAFLSVFVLSTSLFFMRYTQRAMMDMPVAFAVTLGIYAVVSAEKTGRSKFYYLFGFAAALGYYFKGIQGLYVLPVTWLYLLFTGQVRKIFSANFILSNLLAFALMGLWAVPQYTVHGGNFLYSQSGIGPLVHGGLPGYENPFYNPFKNLLRMYYWIIISAVGMYLGFKSIRKGENRNDLVMLFIWFFVIMAALSVSSVFGVRYLIPALVPASMFAALALFKFIGERRFAYFQHTATAFAALVFFAAVVFPFPPPKEESKYVPLFRCAENVVPEGAKIVLFGKKPYIFNQGLVFYAGRPLDAQADTCEELLIHVRASKPVFIIANPEDHAYLKSVFFLENFVVFASSSEWVLFQIADWGKDGAA